MHYFMRVFLSVFVLFGIAGGVRAPGIARYYENFEDPKRRQYTKVHFIDKDAGERLPESESLSYIVKSNNAYTLVMGKFEFGLSRPDRSSKMVFKIVTYGYKSTCPSAGSPAAKESLKRRRTDDEL